MEDEKKTFKIEPWEKGQGEGGRKLDMRKSMRNSQVENKGNN